MRNRKALGFVAAGLAAGLVLGSIGIATAVTKSAETTSSNTATGTPTPSDDAARGPRGPRGTGPDGMKRGFGGVGDIAEALANLTDLSVSEIEDKRADGKSYAAIAKAEGVSTDELIAETVKIEQDECDTAEKDGTLTSTEADEIMDGIEERLQSAIESTEQTRGGHGGPRDGERGAADDSDSDSSATTQQ